MGYSGKVSEGVKIRKGDTKGMRAYGAIEVLVCRVKDSSVSSTVVFIAALQRERGGRSQLVGVPLLRNGPVSTTKGIRVGQISGR